MNLDSLVGGLSAAPSDVIRSFFLVISIPSCLTLFPKATYLASDPSSPAPSVPFLATEKADSLPKTAKPTKNDFHFWWNSRVGKGM